MFGGGARVPWGRAPCPTASSQAEDVFQAILPQAESSQMAGADGTGAGQAVGQGAVGDMM